MPGKAAAPAALALTGSKSTNHALNVARASPSNARPVRRFCSILSSKAPKTAGYLYLLVDGWEHHGCEVQIISIKPRNTALVIE